MGTNVLKGITTGLLVTVLTLIAVLGTTLVGIDKNIISYLIDFGLLLSCLAAGYRASRGSGSILLGGLAAGGYAIIGILLLALYFSIDTLGAVKIISEGIGLGLLAGVLGAGVISPGRDSYERLSVRYPGYPRTNRDNPERSVFASRSDFPDRDPIAARFHPEEERRRILELCNKTPEEKEEDEAFEWWRVESERQLRGK
ncbi:MAG: hypothetical protein ACOX7U_03500 [Desulfitobacteriia bacterium]|jgi:hypothetical protein